MSTYNYDGWNRLTGANVGGTTASYKYRGNNLREEKTVTNADGTKTISFVYDGMNIIYDDDGTTQNDYVRGLTGIIYRTDADNVTNYFRTNQHGDISSITSTTGTVNKTYEYDAYGNVMEQTGTDKNPFAYCGEYYDEETGFIYLRNRYYDPSLGRFITEDPIQDGMNWYAYCRNNPIRYIDPTGYITQEEIDLYESGKMAPMAYSHLMNLTFHWYLADDEASKGIYHQWAEDFRANDYKTTNGAFPNVDAGIEYMPSMFFGEPTKEQHYFRNQLNLNFSWSQYTTLQERLPENMKWDDKVASDYHQNNTVNNKPNRKYVSFDGHFELVYNDNNILLTEYNNPHDMGTYNYVHPTKDPIGHGIKDVKPYGAVWIKWGNVPEHAGALYK